jgi:signal transduction histidine kinase
LGDWSPKIKTIQVYLTIPFWERTTTKIGSLLVGVMMVGFIGSLVTKRVYRRKIHRIEKEREMLLERERLSRDLHDSIGTQLSLIMHHLDNGRSVEDAKISAAKEIASYSMQHLRETIWALKTEEADLAGFAKRLERFIQKKLVGTSIDLEATIKVDRTIPLKPTMVIHLLRIVEEVVANAIKYSETTRFHVGIFSDDRGWKMELEDFGRGFSSKESEAKESYGLLHLHQRANEMGGKLNVESGPGEGTKITLTLLHE